MAKTYVIAISDKLAEILEEILHDENMTAEEWVEMQIERYFD